MVINALRSRERARYVPERRSHGGQPWSLTGNASAQTQVSQSAGDGDAAPQTSQADSPRSAKLACGGRHSRGNVGGLPRTRRRSIHASRNLSRAPSASLVIGYADPGQNRSAVRFGSSRVRGRGLGRAGRGPLAGRGPMSVTRTRASRCPVSCAAGSHAGSHADERPSSSSD
jgi:hypothetical protein